MAKLKAIHPGEIPREEFMAPLRLNGRVALDENEGDVKAQNSRAVILAPRRCQSQLEDRSSETLAVNQRLANRSTNHRYGLVPRP